MWLSVVRWAYIIFLIRFLEIDTRRIVREGKTIIVSKKYLFSRVGYKIESF